MSERLTDEEMDVCEAPFIDDTGDMYGLDDAAPLVPRAIHELRERRAADLTAEEREALAPVRKLANVWLDGEMRERALAVLDLLIGGKP